MPSVKEFIISVILFTLLLFGMSEIAPAAEPQPGDFVVYAHTFSYHQNQEPGYNELNWGLGARYYPENNFNGLFDYVAGGFYRNSEYGITYYEPGTDTVLSEPQGYSGYLGLGKDWTLYRHLRAGLLAGAVTGYDAMSPAPMVLPVITLGRASVIVAPYPELTYHLTIDLIKF
jgi:hypothetical protein